MHGLANIGLEAVHPDQELQERLTAVIAAVKAGNTKSEIGDELKNIIREMRENDVYIVVMACTELSVIYPEGNGIVDALDCLVDEIVHQVKGI